MFDVIKSIKSPTLRIALVSVGIITTGLIAVHYSKQIKLAQLKIEEEEAKRQQRDATN